MVFPLPLGPYIVQHSPLLIVKFIGDLKTVDPAIGTALSTFIKTLSYCILSVWIIAKQRIIQLQNY